MFAPQAKLHVQTVRMRLRTSELQTQIAALAAASDCS
jgi:hypothetical protein